MPDNSQKLELIRAIRQSGYPGSATEVFQAHDQGQDLVGQWVQQQQQQQEMQQQQSPQGPQGMEPGGPPPPPPNRRPDGRVSQPNINQPIDSNQGHLVQSQSPSSVGIQNLPTGPAQGQMIQAREGGVRQSKSYVEQYRNGGGIFRTKKQRKIDEINSQISQGTYYENPNEVVEPYSQEGEDAEWLENFEENFDKDMQYKDYTTNLAPWKGKGNISTMDQATYEQNVQKFGANVANQMYMNQETGKGSFHPNTVASTASLGYNPYTGGVNTIDKLKSKFTVGDHISEGHDFKTYDPDFLPPSAINTTEVTSTAHNAPMSTNAEGFVDENSAPLEGYAYENYDNIGKFDYLNQDPSVNKYGLTDTEMIQMNNQVKYNSRYNDGSSITGFNTDQGTPVRENKFMGNTYGGYLDTKRQFKQNQMSSSINKAQGDFANWWGDRAKDIAMAPVNVAKYAYNNPKDAALFGADLLAGAMTIAPEPITTGLGASWLAYRGSSGLYNQHTKHKSDPDNYDPIGFNLQTLGNTSYFIPGVGAGNRLATKYIPKTMKLGKETVKYGANTAHQAIKKGGESFIKPITNTPFRSTISGNVTPTQNIVNRVTNTAVGRTFASNVNKAGTGFKNLRYGNQTINNPIAKRFFTNQNQLNVLGKGATVGTTYAPGQYINMGGKIYNRFRGAAQGSYYSLKVPSQALSAYTIGEHVSDPKNLLSLDKNLEFGTDLANTFYGGQAFADFAKGSIYAAQGDTKKAIDQGIGLFSPFKTISRISKTYDKLK